MKSRSIKFVAQSLVLLFLCSRFALSQEPELVVQTSHVGWIQSLAFSPDGHILASGGGDGTIKLWEVNSGRQIRTLRGHPHAVWEKGKNPNASESKDPLVNAFENIASRQVLNTPFSLAFSPDGRLLASGSNARSIIIWDVATGEPKISISSPVSVWFVAFSRDGSKLLSRSEFKDEKDSYRFWDVASGNELKADAIDLSSFHLRWQSPDGKLRAAYSEQETEIKILDSSDVQVDLLSGHEAGVREVVFSPNGNNLASGGWDRTVRLWDIRGREKSKTLGRHDSFVSALAFSTDGKFLASGSADLTITVWDVSSGRKLRDFRGYTSSVQPFSFGKDLTMLVAASGVMLQIWDLRRGIKYADTRIHSGYIENVVLSPDRQQMATSDGLRMTITQFARLQDKKFPPDLNDWVGGTTLDQLIRIWDLERGIQQRALKGHTEQIAELIFSPDGKKLASYTALGELKVWYLNSEKEPITRVENKSISAIAFSPDNKILGISEYGVLEPDGVTKPDRIIKLWDFESQTEVVMFLEFDRSRIERMTFSSDGKSLITYESRYDSNNNDNLIVKLWDLQTHKPKDTFSPAKNPEKLSQVFELVPDLSQNPNNIPYTANNRFYALSDSNGRVELYDNGVKVYDSRDNKLLAWLIALGNKGWAVVTPEGHFDTNSLERPEGLNWVFPDAPLTPLSFEIFMRDYYVPRLIPRLLRGEKLPEIPSLAELNRSQPQIGEITILPIPGEPDSVNVKVEVASIAGQCLKDTKYVRCESGVHDLRLYRDGQLVGQSPYFEAAAWDVTSNNRNRQPQLAQWRKTSLVKSPEGAPITVASGKREVMFSNIHLPRRPGVSQVTFTAYAFNEDRVKSETSAPSVYALPEHRTLARRRAYIIAMGVDATSDPSLRLGFAPTGAREIERLLTGNLKAEYEVIAVPLISEYREDSTEWAQDLATKSNLKTVLSILAGRKVGLAQRQLLPNHDKLQAVTPDDLVVLYIASHGYADPDGRFYAIPSDIGKPAGVSELLLNRCIKDSGKSPSCQAAQEFLRRSISSDEMTQWLQSIDAGQTVLVLDSCHSGAVSGPDFKPGPMGDRGFGQLSYDKGMLVLVATQADNFDWGLLELGDQSLLTYALTHQQTAAGAFDLGQWLRTAERRVPDLYRRLVRTGQLPISTIEQEPALFDFSNKFGKN